MKNAILAISEKKKRLNKLEKHCQRNTKLLHSIIY